jgi:transposase
MDRFDVMIQFGLAHLIRDVKSLMTLPDARDRAYGEQLREALRELFKVIHRREHFAAKQFQSQLNLARFKVLSCATIDVPATRHSRNMVARFEKHDASYFRFITTRGVESTNDLVKQAIRFVVIDRLITQGTRSE